MKYHFSCFKAIVKRIQFLNKRNGIKRNTTTKINLEAPYFTTFSNIFSSLKDLIAINFRSA